VVLEAFAAGIPVLGSNLGGIAELVTDGVDGVLVEPDSVDDWARTLARLADNPVALAALRAGVRPPRRLSVVASEMRKVYDNVLGVRGAARMESGVA
jgi:glycosyltransferase involved in cell wall biosynthesis